jgi:CRISPR/Cas system CMR-associated protein Cmr1 (group 7 of RAMP superfamily)
MPPRLWYWLALFKLYSLARAFCVWYEVHKLGEMMLCNGIMELETTNADLRRQLAELTESVKYLRKDLPAPEVVVSPTEGN